MRRRRTRRMRLNPGESRAWLNEGPAGAEFREGKRREARGLSECTGDAVEIATCDRATVFHFHGRTENPDGQAGTLQSVIVPKSRARTKREARTVAREHGAHRLTAEESDHAWRFRQRAPERCVLGSYRSKRLPDGVTLVYCHPR